MNIEYGFQSKDKESRFALAGDKLFVYTGHGDTFKEEMITLPGWAKQFIMEITNKELSLECQVNDLLDLITADGYCIRSHKGDCRLEELADKYNWKGLK